MGNLNLLGSVRKAYSDPTAFNYYQTTKHNVQSSLHDVIKGMWFCVRNEMFKVTPGKVPLEFPIHKSTAAPKKVSKSFTEIISKGEKKVRDKFHEKLHDCFPSFRTASLENVLNAHHTIQSSEPLH